MRAKWEQTGSRLHRTYSELITGDSRRGFWGIKGPRGNALSCQCRAISRQPVGAWSTRQQRGERYIALSMGFCTLSPQPAIGFLDPSPSSTKKQEDELRYSSRQQLSSYPSTIPGQVRLGTDSQRSQQSRYGAIEKISQRHQRRRQPSQQTQE